MVLPGAGIAGRGVARGIRAAGALAAGTLAARRILVGLNAGAIVGFGGYPSVPPVVAARLARLHIPVILHEQNAVLGRANRALCRIATLLALSADPTTRVPAGMQTALVGNPVRPAIAALADLPYLPPEADGPINLLVTGGSLGARVLSEVVPQAVIALPETLRARLRVVQQARQEDAGAVRAAYEAAGITAEVAPFFADIPRHLGAAHLVIARAGASTIAELAVAGRPAILVPLPNAIDDHQTANAAGLASLGAAWVMPQPQFTVSALTARLIGLLTDPLALVVAAEAARGQSRASAVGALADLVERMLVRETQS